MKFLVLRSDAIRRGQLVARMINSSCFPIEVQTPHDGVAYTSEDIVRMAFDQINKGYVGMHEYIVVPMYEASVVRFRPKAQYEVSVSPYV